MVKFKPIHSLTLDEAVAERESLVQKMIEIDGILANKNVVDNNGRRLQAKEYWKWRDSIAAERREYQKRALALKSIIRDQRKDFQMSEGGIEDDSDLALLKAANKILQAFEPEDFSQTEQAVIDRIRDRVNGL